MSERHEKPRSLATRKWRERTGLKLVQIYLDTPTTEILDTFVQIHGLSGRAKVIEELIYAEVDRCVKD